MDRNGMIAVGGMDSNSPLSVPILSGRGPEIATQQ